MVRLLSQSTCVCKYSEERRHKMSYKRLVFGLTILFCSYFIIVRKRVLGDYLRVTRSGFKSREGPWFFGDVVVRGTIRRLR